MRLDAYLAAIYPDYSRSQLSQYITAGLVEINGCVIKKPSMAVDDGDEVVFHPPAKQNFTDEIAEFAQHNVVYMDDNVIVISKPAGMLVHAKGGIVSEFTVADFVRHYFDIEELNSSEDNNRLGIVHRLDRATSGVMICARNLTTASMLSRQFAERKAHKTYLAMTENAPSEMSARIDLPIGRNLSRPSTFRVDGKGKPAITDYTVLRINGDNTALVELKPQTGRTHQLRVHLAYLGCPILGDPVYGHGKYGDRLMLHAYKLEITIPGVNGGERRVFIAEPPSEFGYDG